MQFLDSIIRNLTIVCLSFGFLVTLPWLVLMLRRWTSRGQRPPFLKALTPLVVAVLLSSSLWIPSVKIKTRTMLLNWPDPLCPRTQGHKLIIFLHGWLGD